MTTYEMKKQEARDEAVLFFSANFQERQLDIVYPTWQEVYDSLSNPVYLESYTFSAQDAVKEWQDLSKPINWDWD